MSGKEHFIKVFADSPWPAVCKVCRAPVLWAKTVTNPRWVLFNAEAEKITDRADENGTFVNYWPSTLVHWNTCVERGADQSEREPAAGERAGS